MMTLFQQLEPRFEEKGSVLYQELEEITEIFFHEKGQIDIGFEINTKPKFVMRINKGSILGAYNCSFNKRTMFLYKCHTKVEGYMLRKENWFEIMEEYEEIADILKENVKNEYTFKIKIKINA